jgi:multiple sugar transport system substrate-binding protein
MGMSVSRKDRFSRGFSPTHLLPRLVVLLLPLWLGCKVESKTATVVEFWAMGREGEVVARLLPEFERRNPAIHVRVQQIPWSAAHEKLLTAYVGGVMPDVFQAGNTWLPELVALKALEPLDRRIAGSGAVKPDDEFAGILDTNVIDGSTYGVPWYVDTRLLFYRTDSLVAAGYDRPPRTWDSWLDAMTRIKTRAGADKYAILLPLREWQTPVILALQLGAELLRDNEQYGNFRSAPFRRAFAFYLDLFRRGLAPHTGEAQVANLYQDFADAYFAMYITGPWNIGEFKRRLPAAMEDKWSTAPMPGPGNLYPGASLAGGASLAIFRGSEHKEAAWKLIEYLCEPRQQVEFYRLTGDLPSRKSAWENEALAHNRYAQAFWTQLQAVRSTPKIPEWERIADAITRYSEAASRGDVTEEEALVALDRDVDATLEKRRWLLRSSTRRVATPAAD